MDANAIAPGARVYLHQAFRCCPYAGAVSSRIHDYLAQNGYALVTDPAEADVHVVNTCGSDARQAALTYDALAGIQAHTPAAAVVVTGCLVSIEPTALRGAMAPFAQAARFDPRHLDGLDDVFRPATVGFDAVSSSVRNAYTGTDFSDGWAHVLASTGCLGTCSFCAIRRATGRPKSRSVADVRADIARAVDGGVHDILLVSTDLSAWGTDRGETVVDLLRAVVEAPGDFLVSGESFEPTLLLHHFEALLPLFASGRFAFLGMPIQSGSARVLRRMERTYDPDAVLEAVRRLKEAAPSVLVRTDLLYGFGDETEAEFDASLRASRAFDLPSFNVYQPRPGTAPLELAPEVLHARRDRALEELRARAQAGWPTVRRWGGAGSEPDVSNVSVPDESPAQTPAGRAWIQAHAARFARVLARGRMALGEGWALVAAEATGDAVVLTLDGPNGALRVGLRHPDWPGAVMARTARFAMWVDGESHTPDAAQDRALKRLLVALGATALPG